MPWTPKQKRYLLSAGSPLTLKQMEKMRQELHRNPRMGHAKKGAVVKKEQRGRR